MHGPPPPGEDRPAAASLNSWAAQRLENYQRSIDRLLAVGRPAYRSTTLCGPSMTRRPSWPSVGQQASLLDSVHPEKEVRDGGPGADPEGFRDRHPPLTESGRLPCSQRDRSQDRGSPPPATIWNGLFCNIAYPASIVTMRPAPKSKNCRTGRLRYLAGLQPQCPGRRQAHSGHGGRPPRPARGLSKGASACRRWRHHA